MAGLITNSTTNIKRTTGIDEVDGNTTYFGFAKLGTASSEAKWQIFKLSKTGTTSMLQYADGDTRYDNIWDNRLSLTYSS